MDSSSKFTRDYGIYILGLHSLDGEIYINYLLDLLENDRKEPTFTTPYKQTQIYQFLHDCHVQEEAIPSIISSLERISCEEVIDSEKSQSSRFINEPPAAHQQLEEEEEEEEDPFLHDIGKITSNEIDWITLIESLESHLLAYYQYSQPEFSPPALMVALYKAYYQVDAAAQILLNAVQTLNQCKPCRHLLQQGCFRKDCHFDHDLKKFPCRYWLHSVCANAPQYQQSTEGDQLLTDLTQSGNCVFSHDLPYFQPQYYDGVVNESSNDTSSFPLNQIDQSAVEEFPSLASSFKSQNKSNSKTNPYLSALKTSSSTQSSVHEFPTLNSSSSSGKAKLNAKANGAFIDNKRVFGDLLEKAQFITRRSGGFTDTRTNKVRPTDWVESGEAIRHDYEQLRQEARQYAIARNKLLQEATLAYVSGSKSTAKSLSAQGQFMNQHMKGLHVKAAKAIFRNRNTLTSLEAGKIDLHGLHVSEALDCVTELIPIYEKSGMKRITIVTGTGHHTKGPQQGKARLLPYIRDLCEYQLHLKVQEVKDVSGYSGGLVVSLPGN